MTAPQPDLPAGAELAEDAQLTDGPVATRTGPAAILPLRTPIAALAAAAAGVGDGTAASRTGVSGDQPAAVRRLRWPEASTVRVLLAAVTGPVLASYAATVALVALLSVTAGAEWSLAGTLRAAVPFWLAAHQVPLSITAPGAAAAPFGVLPLLPTVGLAVLVARSAGGAAVRLGWYEPVRLGLLAAVFGGVHGGLGLLVAVLAPSSRIAAAPAHALLGCAVISAMAATCGGMRAARLDTVASPLLPPWAVRGVRAGLAGLAALLAAGALCTFGGLLLSAATAHEVLAGWGGAIGGQFGVTALSIAYLPNAAVAALSWTSGPGLSVGAVSVTPFSTTAGPLPAVPLLAALPEPGPAPWRVLVFALPLLAGVLVARHCRRIPGDPTDRLHAVVTAGAVASSGCFVLAILAGGRLGGGAFDPVRIPPASLAIAVFVWLVLPAGLIVGLADRSTRGPGVLADAVPEPDPELERYAEVELLADAGLDLQAGLDPGAGLVPEAEHARKADRDPEAGSSVEAGGGRAGRRARVGRHTDAAR